MTIEDLKIACVDYMLGININGEAPPGLVNAMKAEVKASEALHRYRLRLTRRHGGIVCR